MKKLKYLNYLFNILNNNIYNYNYLKNENNKKYYNPGKVFSTIDIIRS